ncbi:MAG: hypothetical protein V3U20_04840 [Thermoplasmata archaeon]
MKRRWCVREGVFETEDGLWWLNKEQNDVHEKSRTPMTIALRNGDISKVIDVKLDGLYALSRRRGGE